MATPIATGMKPTRPLNTSYAEWIIVFGMNPRSLFDVKYRFRANHSNKVARPSCCMLEV